MGDGSCSRPDRDPPGSSQIEGWHLLSNEPDNLLLQADGLFDCRRLDDAQSKYEEYLENQPESWHALNRLARIQAMRGRIRAMVRTCFRWQEVLQRRAFRSGRPRQKPSCASIHTPWRSGLNLQHLGDRRRDDLRTTAVRMPFFVEVSNGELPSGPGKALGTYGPHRAVVDLAGLHMARGMREAVVSSGIWRAPSQVGNLGGPATPTAA